MALRVQRDRGFRVGFALLVTIGIFLGFKTQQAISLALGAMNRVSVDSGSRPLADRMVLAQIADRDRLLAATGSLERDPFRSPRDSHVDRNPTPQRRESTGGVPVLRALLFDNVNPSVQLSIGAHTSDWLREGDSYEGWVVMEIGVDSVRISKGDQSLVLSTS